MKYFYLILIVHWLHNKNIKGNESTTTISLFCQVQCDNMVYICQSRQLGHILMHEKEDREFVLGDGQTVP